MKTRYIKVLRDLISDYRKNLLLILAIAIGVFGLGAVLGGYSVLKREMKDNYMSSVPASATIETENNITPGLIDSLKSIRGIKVAERHATVSGRMKVGDKWHPILLFVIDDFENKRTNKIAYQSGDSVPATGSMLVERTALQVMKAGIGDEIVIKTPNGRAGEIRISGTVHDTGLAPAWQEGAGYGYITLATLRQLGERQGFNQLRILVSEQADSKQHITAKAEEIAHWLNDKGYAVHEIQVPSPGKHPHQSQMTAVMTIFVIFCFMILILGSTLVATSMATLMVKQVRQIGIMKTIGARSWQITRLYLFMMLIICVVTLLVAVPLSRLASVGFYQQIAVLLNLEIRNGDIPGWVLWILIASGLIIPYLAVVFPVFRGSRISVRQALDNYGVRQIQSSISAFVNKLSQLGFFSEVFRLSIRNVFRQRSRLAMTLGLLAAGGAMFMTALNVSDAWDDNLSRLYTQRLYDLEVRLNHATMADSLIDKIEKIPGITFAEGWNYSSTSFLTGNAFEISNTYPDKGHGSFTMQALPVPTKLLDPTVIEGHWLSQSNADDVVLNQLARTLSPEVKIGDRITLSVDGIATQWNVIGFTEDVGSPATAYVSLGSFSKGLNPSGKVKMLRIAYKDRSEAGSEQKNLEVEKMLEGENISVNATIPVWLLHNAIAAHMEVLVNSLMTMAILMALVGTIGLMSTMSMNIMERTREIGVMRAIGATPEKIKNLVVWEGIIIGALSILIAFVLSIFLSYFFGWFIGNMAFRTPLSLTLSIAAFAIWVVIIVAGSYLATFFPARRANRITTREALAYE